MLPGGAAGCCRWPQRHRCCQRRGLTAWPRVSGCDLGAEEEDHAGQVGAEQERDDRAQRPVHLVVMGQAGDRDAEPVVQRLVAGRSSSGQIPRTRVAVAGTMRYRKPNVANGSTADARNTAAHAATPASGARPRSAPGRWLAPARAMPAATFRPNAAPVSPATLSAARTVAITPLADQITPSSPSAPTPPLTEPGSAGSYCLPPLDSGTTLSTAVATASRALEIPGDQADDPDRGDGQRDQRQQHVEAPFNSTGIHAEASARDRRRPGRLQMTADAARPGRIHRAAGVHTQPGTRPD